MLLNSRNLGKDIKIAGITDYCYICARKLSENEKIPYTQAVIKSQGKLENKAVFHGTFSGVDRCICPNCIKDIAKALNINILEDDIEKSEDKVEK